MASMCVEANSSPVTTFRAEGMRYFAIEFLLSIYRPDQLRSSAIFFSSLTQQLITFVQERF